MSSRFQSAFLLWYSPSDEDESLIGVYASRADALAALANIKAKAGTDVCSFEIDEYQVGKEQWVPYLTTERVATH